MSNVISVINVIPKKQKNTKTKPIFETFGSFNNMVEIFFNSIKTYFNISNCKQRFFPFECLHIMNFWPAAYEKLQIYTQIKM